MTVSGSPRVEIGSGENATVALIWRSRRKRRVNLDGWNMSLGREMIEFGKKVRLCVSVLSEGRVGRKCNY